MGFFVEGGDKGAPPVLDGNGSAGPVVCQHEPLTPSKDLAKLTRTYWYTCGHPIVAERGQACFAHVP
jgi:hypothetical protein